MSKIGKLKQRLAMIWDLAGEKAPVARNIDIDDAEVQAHPKKYGLKHSDEQNLLSGIHQETQNMKHGLRNNTIILIRLWEIL